MKSSVSSFQMDCFFESKGSMPTNSITIPSPCNRSAGPVTGGVCVDKVGKGGGVTNVSDCCSCVKITEATMMAVAIIRNTITPNHLRFLLQHPEALLPEESAG
mmetsp:Transcript_11954/g.21751  ORF Transcript_11954/g.21751 Transcript_11954/m.21751 type:complete len:103 (-) Transcript_11954:891-1199(-)